MLVELQGSFAFAPGWYRGEPTRSLALHYYFVLRSVLCGRPELRRYLARCRHCRIFFLADPRNAGRQDLGCPFGCAEAHRRRRSSERSMAYNRTESGKAKRRRRREQRRTAGGPQRRAQSEQAPGALPCAGSEAPGVSIAEACKETAGDPALQGPACATVAWRTPEGIDERLAGSQCPQSQEEMSVRFSRCPDVRPDAGRSKGEPQEVAFEAGIVEYVRAVVSLIEARRVMGEEVLEMLRRTRRQHSLVRQRRIDYVLLRLEADPP